jgi:hypothetical protein
MPPRRQPQGNIIARTRPERGGVHGFFRDGFLHSFDTSEKNKRNLKIAALSGLSTRLVAPAGVLGMAAHVGIGLGVGIWSGIEGYKRVREEQGEETFSTKLAAVQEKLDTAYQGVETADNEETERQKTIRTANYEIDIINRNYLGGRNGIPTINTGGTRGNFDADVERALERLDQGKNYYDEIIGIASKAQDQQKAVNQKLCEAHRELVDAWGIDIEALPPVRVRGAAPPPGPRTNTEGISRRNNALAAAMKKLIEARREKSEVDQRIRQVVGPSLNRIITNAHRVNPDIDAGSFRLPAVSSDGTVRTWTNPDPNAPAEANADLRDENITIRDFSDIIERATAILNEETRLKTKIVEKHDSRTRAEDQERASQTKIINAQEALRQANQDYTRLVPMVLDPHTGIYVPNLAQAELNFERRQRNRRIMGAIGGFAAGALVWFGGGRVFNGLYNLLTGMNNPTLTGMGGLTEDIANITDAQDLNPATNGLPWWRSWFG